MRSLLVQERLLCSKKNGFLFGCVLSQKIGGLFEMIEPEFSFCFCGGEFERINEKTWECNKCGLVIFQKEG